METKIIRHACDALNTLLSGISERAVRTGGGECGVRGGQPCLPPALRPAGTAVQPTYILLHAAICYLRASCLSFSLRLHRRALPVLCYYPPALPYL